MKYNQANFIENSVVWNTELAGATLIRALMKNHPDIRQNLFAMLRDRIEELGVLIDSNVWEKLVVASADELEDSKAHVIE